MRLTIENKTKKTLNLFSIRINSSVPHSVC